MSHGELQLWPVRLYSTLEALLEQEWIRELEDSERPPQSSARRRYYRITETGRKHLAGEANRLEAMGRQVRLQLEGGESRG